MYACKSSEIIVSPVYLHNIFEFLSRSSMVLTGGPGRAPVCTGYLFSLGSFLAAIFRRLFGSSILSCLLSFFLSVVMVIWRVFMPFFGLFLGSVLFLGFFRSVVVVIGLLLLLRGPFPAAFWIGWLHGPRRAREPDGPAVAVDQVLHAVLVVAPQPLVEGLLLLGVVLHVVLQRKDSAQSSLSCCAKCWFGCKYCAPFEGWVFCSFECQMAL